MSERELKPCPFCGNENVAIANECHDLSGGYFIACPACGGSTGLRYACGDDPRPLLIEQWNRRTARSGQAASGSSQGARSDRTRSQKLADAGFTRRPSLWAMQARETLELIAAPQRPDGSWNRDREACRQLAAEALGRHTDSDVQNGVGQPEAPTAAPPDFSADAVRAKFEESFLDYFGRQPEGAAFDKLGGFWLARTEDGRYEIARVDDAWTGWLAAARYYAHIETLWRVAKLGHEQAFAECQRLAAPPAASGDSTPPSEPAVWPGAAQTWKWMTHPHWNEGFPIPVLLTTDPDSGEVWYQPFSTSCTDFEWACRDKEWAEVAAPVQGDPSGALRPEPEAVGQGRWWRKKPVVIEAFQWNGLESGCQAAKARFPELETRAKNGWTNGRPEVTYWRIRTLEGHMRVSPGDWIVRGVAGEFYPCKPDIFAATYEPAEPPQGASGERGD